MTNDDLSPSNSTSELIRDKNDAHVWSMPEIGGHQVISSADQIQQKRRQEFVEDVDQPEEVEPLTADQLKNLADEAYQQAFQEGHEEGFKKGMEKGLMEGGQQGKKQAYDQYSTKLDDQTQRLKSIADGLLTPLEDQQGLLERVIMDIAVNVTKRLIKDEIQQAPRLLFNMVTAAIEEMPMGKKNITVFLNPDDFTLMREQGLTPQEWNIQIDPSVHTASYRIESEDSLVTYDVEEKMNSYITALSQAPKTAAINTENLIDIEEPLESENTMKELEALHEALSDEQPNDNTQDHDAS